MDLTEEDLEQFLDNMPLQGAQWEQVVACILAVPRGSLVEKQEIV